MPELFKYTIEDVRKKTASLNDSAPIHIARGSLDVDKIIKENDLPPDLIDKLSQLSLSRLNTLLMQILIEKIKNTTPAEIVSRFKTDRFTQPSSVDPLLLREFGAFALSCLPTDYKGVELSPIAPLGLVPILTNNDPKKTLLTPRGAVIADIPTYLALLAAIDQRKYGNNKGKATPIKLAAISRVVRTQDFSRIPGFRQHFESLALVAHGKASDKYGFELQEALKHLRYYINLVNDSEQFNLRINKLRVVFSDIRFTEALIQIFEVDRHLLGKITQSEPDFSLLNALNIKELPSLIPYKDIELAYEKIDKLQTTLCSELQHLLDQSQKDGKNLLQHLSNLSKVVVLYRYIKERLIDQLSREFPWVDFAIHTDRLAGIGHYPNLCAHMFATNSAGEEYPLVDLGTPIWAEKLTGNPKHRTVSSGLGTELLLNMFS